MRFLLLLIFIPPAILGVSGALFTSNKLERMKQIRGWKPGATVRTEVVRQSYHYPESNAYWVELVDDGTGLTSRQRLYLPRETWEGLQAGSTIEVVYLPGDPWPYTRDSVYASEGNFAFDRGLLVVEFGMVAVALLGSAITVCWPLLFGRGARRARRLRR
jgi:hypothetical protein